MTTTSTGQIGATPTFLGFSRYSNNVLSSHVTPLLTLAAVYEKPSLWPDLRPKILHYGRYCKHYDWCGLYRNYAPVQVGSDLVGLASAEGVALSAPSLEEGSTLRGITCGVARYHELYVV